MPTAQNLKTFPGDGSLIPEIPSSEKPKRLAQKTHRTISKKKSLTGHISTHGGYSPKNEQSRKKNKNSLLSICGKDFNCILCKLLPEGLTTLSCI